MKLRIYSDVHFDEGLNGISDNKDIKQSLFYEYFGEQMINSKDDCLDLIAGDIAANIDNTMQFLNTFSKNSCFILGNHAVYNHEMIPLPKIIKNYKNLCALTKDVFLENDVKIYKDENIAIIGSEFFTDYEYFPYTIDEYNEQNEAWNVLLNSYLSIKDDYVPTKKLTKKRIIQENMFRANQYLNDFSWGYASKYKKLTPNDYLRYNRLAKKKILELYNKTINEYPSIKIILMTHHCLSPKCLSNKFSKSKANASYVSDLEDWIDVNMPRVRLIISGHVHNRKDFIFGKNKIRYICNPCGYIKYNEPFLIDDKEFNPNLIINSEDL